VSPGPTVDVAPAAPATTSPPATMGAPAAKAVTPVPVRDSPPTPARTEAFCKAGFMVWF
jgi:hypothetical protein